MNRAIFAIAVFLLPALAFAQVQQSGSVTARHLPYWVTSGVIGDGGSATDSPITTMGVTNNGGAGFCVSSDRQTNPRNQLCFGASSTGPSVISTQNYGVAAQGLQFVVNGTPITIPTGGANIITGNPPFTAGDLPCFLNSGGVLIDCGIAAGGGVITGGVWAGTPVAVAHGGTGATSAGQAQTNLGLGTLATQNANSVVVTGGTITGLPTPAAASDAAIKSYVDATAQGLTILAQSNYATAAVLPNSPTYSNGASGVGATLTAGSSTTLTVDGSVVTANQVVVVKNQAAPAQNGIYSLTTAGGGVPWVLTRVTYFDQAAEMKAGSYSFVTAGSTNINSAFVLNASITTVGTDAVNFNLFSITGGGVTSIDAKTGIFTTGGGITSTSGNVIQFTNASTPVRQAILSGSVDATGFSNFASAGSGLNVNLTATALPLTMSFAYGFNATTGSVDYVGQLATDASSYWASLPVNQYSFLAVDRNVSTGALTATQTLMRPQKGPVFYSPRQALLHFENSLVDDWGNAWASNGASFSSGTVKFGTYSLRLNGTSSYAQSAAIFNPGQKNWTMDVWSNLDSNVNANIFSVGNAFGVFVGTNPSGKLQLWLSSNGVGWDISGPTTGTTTVSAATWHQIELTYDGAVYRLFLDGTVEVSVTSSLVVWPDGAAMAVGAQVGIASTTAGYFDEFDFVPFARNVANFTPPVAAYTVSGDWYDTNAQQMKTASGAGPTWSVIQRMYVAEATTNGSAVTAVYPYSAATQHTGSDFALSAAGKLRVGNHVIYAEGTPQFISGSTPGTPCVTEKACAIGAPSTWVFTPSQVPPDAKWFEVQINVFHAAIGGTNPGNQDCTLQSRIPVGTIQGFIALGAEYSNFSGFGTVTNTFAFTESSGGVARYPVVNGVAAFETTIGGGTCTAGGLNNQARIVSGILVGYDMP